VNAQLETKRLIKEGILDVLYRERRALEAHIRHVEDERDQLVERLSHED